MADRSRVSILVADDHPMFRFGLEMALRGLGFGTVVQALNGKEAVKKAAATRFDVVLLDLKMPQLNGLAAAAEIMQLASVRGPAPKVLILSAFDEPAIVKAAKEVGVSAFLTKDVDPEKLAIQIDRLLAGATPVLKWTHVPDLSERETDVLRLLADGLSSREIGHELGISVETVKSYISTLYLKLDVSDRVSAVQASRRLGLLTIEELSDTEVAPGEV